MVRRRKSSFFEDAIMVASKLPWWLCLISAAVAWLLLHAMAVSAVSAPKQIGDLSQVMIGQMLRTGAQFGQYLLPLIFVLGAVVSVVTRWRRHELFEGVSKDRTRAAVHDINWKQFEQLVGESFRRQGFSVQENETGGADGGIDLVIRKDNERFLVQCKQWRALKVGVNVIRELYGVMAAEGAAGGFVVTSGLFTAEAKRFAKGRNIQLVDGPKLQQWIQVGRSSTALLDDTPSALRNDSFAPEERSVLCPLCQSAMVRRTAKRGANAGNVFWGCSTYPSCRGIRQG